MEELRRAGDECDFEGGKRRGREERVREETKGEGKWERGREIMEV